MPSNSTRRFSRTTASLGIAQNGDFFCIDAKTGRHDLDGAVSGRPERVRIDG